MTPFHSTFASLVIISEYFAKPNLAQAATFLKFLNQTRRRLLIFKVTNLYIPAVFSVCHSFHSFIDVMDGTKRVAVLCSLLRRSRVQSERSKTRAEPLSRQTSFRWSWEKVLYRSESMAGANSCFLKYWNVLKWSNTDLCSRKEQEIFVNKETANRLTSHHT